MQERRATVRDDMLPHQIRIIQQGNSSIYLSCTCRKIHVPGYGRLPYFEPFGLFDTRDGIEPVLAAYQEHLDDVSRTDKP